MDTIEVLRERFSSSVSSALNDADTGSKNLLSSIDRKIITSFACMQNYKHV